ncbi:hypothetical protein OBP_131 [Pseudomonas phage OBP]|uniref:hypothetical protein n=1 Tax=Pseudomonas phage OBP TaxID=1124849 RepID=UPI000240D558|nr:hypothetical protein OBP_131 [Pseudomonas phage OBP]AEV89568.1 hypothetical protein OBP_131 [Pseudomonas phage OBP]
MTRHHKYLGSDSKPVEAVEAESIEAVQSTINPSVEEITMTNVNLNNEAAIDANVVDEATVVETEATETLRDIAAVKQSGGFRKGSVAYAGILSGAISAIAMVLARSASDDVKLSKMDILKRTAATTAAATTIQAGVQLAAKRVNNNSTASYVTAHLVGCVTAPVAMRAMVASGFGAEGYKEHGTTESEMLAGVSGPEVFDAVESAPVVNEL